MNCKVLPIHIFNQNQISVEIPSVQRDSNGSLKEVFPNGVIDVELDFPPHLYTWVENNGVVDIVLDDAKYQAYLSELKAPAGLSNEYTNGLLNEIAELKDQLRLTQDALFEIVIRVEKLGGLTHE